MAVLAQFDDFSGHKAILSGPAGGYVGYAVTTKWEGVNQESLQVGEHMIKSFERI